MLVSYEDVDFLFTGDIGDSTEQTIVESGSPVAAEVLKVAHHGSDGSSKMTFLEAVGPELAVISVGADNSYGHPGEDALDRLATVGARVMRTDQVGTIVVTTDGETYWVQPSFLVFLPFASRMESAPTSEPPTTGDVVITDIFYDGEGNAEPDEYVEIRNDDSVTIQLEGWTLRDEASHVFTFPSHLMEPGQVCRVYTNEYHSDYCGFSYDSGSAIWNNSGDCADLRDSTGMTVDVLCY
jgi:hypothetical protein